MRVGAAGFLAFAGAGIEPIRQGGDGRVGALERLVQERVQLQAIAQYQARFGDGADLARLQGEVVHVLVRLDEHGQVDAVATDAACEVADLGGRGDDLELRQCHVAQSRNQSRLHRQRAA